MLLSMSQSDLYTCSLWMRNSERTSPMSRNGSTQSLPTPLSYTTSVDPDSQRLNSHTLLLHTQLSLNNKKRKRRRQVVTRKTSPRKRSNPPKSQLRKRKRKVMVKMKMNIKKRKDLILLNHFLLQNGTLTIGKDNSSIPKTFKLNSLASGKSWMTKAGQFGKYFIIKLKEKVQAYLKPITQ